MKYIEKYNEKYFFGDYLSADFWKKNSESKNKPAMKKFPKNLSFGIDVKL